jgi:hypothetical protein
LFCDHDNQVIDPAILAWLPSRCPVALTPR